MNHQIGFQMCRVGNIATTGFVYCTVLTIQNVRSVWRFLSQATPTINYFAIKQSPKINFFDFVAKSIYISMWGCRDVCSEN